MLPFTASQFLDVFARYNQSVWPAQIVGFAMGIGMIVLVLRPSSHASRAIGLGLSLMWLWTGIAYHAFFFSRINPAAWGFGVLFVVQGLLLMRAALAGRLQFGHPGGKASWLGWALAGYAVIYPLAGLAAGHVYPRLPMFGITPCPVTLFTCGLLLLTTAPPPRGLLPIPFIWSVIGGSAAILLGMAPDWPLWIGAAVIALLGSRHRLRADATAA